MISKSRKSAKVTPRTCRVPLSAATTWNERRIRCARSRDHSACALYRGIAFTSMLNHPVAERYQKWDHPLSAYSKQGDSMAHLLTLSPAIRSFSRLLATSRTPQPHPVRHPNPTAPPGSCLTRTWLVHSTTCSSRVQVVYSEDCGGCRVKTRVHPAGEEASWPPWSLSRCRSES